MHIALVTDYYLPSLGGVQTAVKAQREALERAGHRVTVFCPRLPGDPAMPGVSPLPASPIFRPDGYPFAWSPRRVTAEAATAFADGGVEVVHTHSEMFAALGGIRAARAAGIPLVHTMHGRIDVYTRNVLPVPAATMPLLASLHARQISHRAVRLPGGTPYTATRGARAMWRVMVAQAQAVDEVLVPSDHLRRKLVAQGVTTPMTVLPNGLEPSVLDLVGAPAVRRVRRGEPLRLIWVGRLSPEKRPEVFAHLVDRERDGVVADVFGDGVARAEVARAGARAVRAGTLRLRGATPQEEVLSAMREAHVLVSSSYDFDNQPMVVLEAIASGLPVVVADPDLAEIVPPGAGWCAASPDVDGLAAVLESLRSDPDAVATASAAALAARDRVAVDAAGLEAAYLRARARRRSAGSG